MGNNLFAQKNPLPVQKVFSAKLAADKRIQGFIIDPHRNTPSSILLDASRPIAQNATLSVLSDVLQLRPTIDEMKEKPSTATMNGTIVFLKYQQYYNSIKVEHGTYNAMAKGGTLQSMMGEFYDLALTQTQLTPAINEATALQKALAYVGAQQYMWQVPGMDMRPEGKKPAGELVIVENLYHNKGMRLVYKFNVYASKPLSRSYIYIDALDGSVDFVDRIIKHVNNTGTAATIYNGTQNIITGSAVAATAPYLLSGVTVDGITINTRNLQKTKNYAAAIEFSDADNNWTAAEYNNATFDNAALDEQ